MIREEYGKDNERTVILLHGGGLGPWSMRPLASLLSKDFHVIVPVLDGHAGADRPFTTIRANAEEIIAYIDEELGGHTDLIAGLSLGARTALEILSLRPDITQNAVMESARIIPSGIPERLLECSIRLSRHLLRTGYFSKLRFRRLHLPSSMYDDFITGTSAVAVEDEIAFRTGDVRYEAGPGLSMTEADVAIVYGEKEHPVMRKSALRLRELIPSATVTEIPGLRSGEASTKLHYSYLEIIHDKLR